MTSTVASILVVDDHSGVRDGLIALFEALGQCAAGAAGGPEALAHVRRHRPRLVLLDWMMPDMSGIDVLSSGDG